MQPNANPSPLPSAEQIACDHLQVELEASRRSARRTRIGCIASMLFVAAYVAFLAVTLQTRLLAPEPAAQLLTGYAIQTVDNNIETFEHYVQTEIPPAMQAVPDLLIDRLPVIRATIETELANALQHYSQELSDQLGEHLDTFIRENDEAVQQFVTQAQDPAFITAFGDGLEEQLRSLLVQELSDGRPLADHLQDGLVALQQLESRLDRLAHATDLTPHEKRLRQVIAATMRLTDQTL